MKDRFSNHARQYAAFRPTYPKELYDFILSHIHGKEAAWDVGCGNGQVTRDLAPHFDHVYGTDISEKQLQSAPTLPNVSYSICAADQSYFADNTFDLITVGQALHWFKIPEFFDEVKRVAKPDAVIAVWGYSLLRVDPLLDESLTDFYIHTIGPYWDAERKLVDQQYKNIAFPFKEINAPKFQFTFQWSLEEFQGYLTTWSAVQKYIKQHGSNPVDDFIASIKSDWGNRSRTISFPLFLRVGTIIK